MQPTDLNPILHLDQSPILPTRTQPGSNIPHSPSQTRPEEGIKIRAVTKDQYPPGDDSWWNRDGKALELEVVLDLARKPKTA